VKKQSPVFSLSRSALVSQYIVVELHVSNGSSEVHNAIYFTLHPGKPRNQLEHAAISHGNRFYFISAALSLWRRAVGPVKSKLLSPRITSPRHPLGTVSRLHATYPQLREAMTTGCWAPTPMTRRWIGKLRASAAVASSHSSRRNDH
jgi:hypothetical protein